MRKIPAMTAIVVQCVAAAILYGIVHDQVTARVCVEYFTVFHPTIVPTSSPTVLGLVWGVVATWWVGLGLGLPLAVVAQVGHRPTLSAAELRRPTAILLAVMATLALIVGLACYALAGSGSLAMPRHLAGLIPGSRHAAFLADLGAHNTSYLAGFVGGLVVLGWAWRRRRLKSTHDARAET